MVGNLSLATTTDSQREALFGLPDGQGTNRIHFRRQLAAHQKHCGRTEGCEHRCCQFSILKTQWMCLQGKGGGTGLWPWNMRGIGICSRHIFLAPLNAVLLERSLDTTVGNSM